ncbi:ester cyclase [Streptomyces sp. NPDC057616]|uniref:ester cyclase n=1 Tax=Streptomyces sp. NPDC057616 TaxID=3346183 RepID=UPI003696A5BF
MTDTLPAEGLRPQTVLWEKWMELWNGNRDRAEEILADELTLHIPQYGMPDPAALRTPRQFTGWIDAFRSSFTDARIRTALGPFVDGDHVIARWIFEGTWQSGRPAGATAAPGTPVTLRGADVLRLDERGRIAEYWLSDDLMDVYVRLGAPLPTP